MAIHTKYLFLYFILHTSFVFCEETKAGTGTSTEKVSKSQEILPPCQACKNLANSFKKGMERTARGKFEGGDAHWEESRLGTYADSEIRFVEIQEKLCSDVERGSVQCLQLAEEHESMLEEWWFKKKKDHSDLHNYLCILSLQVCCPENHFGPECKPCPGDVNDPCNGHGFCKGAGTRKGSGQCKCGEAYVGELCDKCKIGYYNETNPEGDWLCAKCDKSCKSHCREGGPKGCEVCADGYQHNVALGCVDLDECVDLLQTVCPENTFCINTMGSYQCIDCDKACNQCTGDGPDSCIDCADGYVEQNGLCIENSIWQRTLHIEIARYATYTGLCIATFIIFRRNTLIASLIGIFVAIYIGLSEYTLGEWDKRSAFRSIKSWLML